MTSEVITVSKGIAEFLIAITNGLVENRLLQYRDYFKMLQNAKEIDLPEKDIDAIKTMFPPYITNEITVSTAVAVEEEKQKDGTVKVIIKFLEIGGSTAVKSKSSFTATLEGKFTATPALYDLDIKLINDITGKIQGLPTELFK